MTAVKTAKAKANRQLQTANLRCDINGATGSGKHSAVCAAPDAPRRARPTPVTFVGQYRAVSVIRGDLVASQTLLSAVSAGGRRIR